MPAPPDPAPRPAIDDTEGAALRALRLFVVGVLAVTVEVVRGQDNRVPEPSADNYVVITPTTRVRLATPVVGYTDTADPGTGGRTSLRRVRQSTELTVQLDVHGPASGDNAQMLVSLLFDGYAAEQFAAMGARCAPLYASDPRQVTFVNGEDQYEDRWTVDVALQVSPVVSVPQDFADQVLIAPQPVPEVGTTGPAVLVPIP